MKTKDYLLDVAKKLAEHAAKIDDAVEDFAANQALGALYMQMGEVTQAVLPPPPPPPPPPQA